MKADYVPLVNALLTKAVSTGQDKVSPTVHTDTALFLVSQLLYPAWEKGAGAVIFSVVTVL